MITFENAVKDLQRAIGDSSDPGSVRDAINQAQREVCRARPWPELKVRAFFNTEAAYTTGTVAVTENSTTVTLTGGTWPSTVASSVYRFAISVSDPWYSVATRSSGAIILLSQAYVQDTDTSTTYIAYKSHYSLASAVDRIEEMWLHEEGHAVPLINAATDAQVTDFLHYPSGPGTPTHFLPIERDSSGNHQVLLGPNTPDDVFRVEYTYRKKATDGTFTGNLDETRWPVIRARALALLYEPEFYDRHLAAQAEFERLLRLEWQRESETETQVVRAGQARYDYGSQQSYLESLMGYGKVQDPS